MTLWRKPWVWLGVLSGFAFLIGCLSFSQPVVQAAAIAVSKIEAVDLLNTFSDYLTRGSQINFFFREGTFMIIKGLAACVNFFADAAYQVSTLGNLFDTDQFQRFYQPFTYLKRFFLTLSLACVFFLLTIGRKMEFDQIFTNMLLVLMIVASLPTLVDGALGLTGEYNEYMNDGKTKPGEQIIIDNLTDVTLFGANGWTTTELDEKNHLTNIKYVEITEQITEPAKIDDGMGLLAYRNTLNFKGEEVADKFSYSLPGWLSFLQNALGSGYYRWDANFGTMIISLAVTLLVYVLSAIRMARIQLEITFNQAFASILAFADIRTMSRFKQVVFNIFASIFTMMCIFAMIRIYNMFTTFAADSDLGLAAYLCVQVGAAWFALDGPVMVERVLGVDAGLQSAWGLVGGAIGAKKLAGLGKKIAGAGANAAISGGAYLAGAMNGLSNNSKPSYAGLHGSGGKTSGGGNAESEKGKGLHQMNGEGKEEETENGKPKEQQNKQQNPATETNKQAQGNGGNNGKQEASEGIKPEQTSKDQPDIQRAPSQAPDADFDSLMAAGGPPPEGDADMQSMDNMRTPDFHTADARSEAMATSPQPNNSTSSDGQDTTSGQPDPTMEAQRKHTQAEPRGIAASQRTIGAGARPTDTKKDRQQYKNMVAPGTRLRKNKESYTRARKNPDVLSRDNRRLGEAAKDRLMKVPFIDRANRAYTLGKNTTSRSRITDEGYDPKNKKREE
ncbi:pLS20_p028 family conjugation system transmembrane protein [Listeria booriae]|uniref:DUF8208 domain-containing protein n=1 Tax=Listeria booriae TaxID=1552123 RepID=A0A7X1CGL3_9LIST|nr:hypothetical protein [Listeria booriae]MBC1563594.1 hypothetical protein [Listeria booriae]